MSDIRLSVLDDMRLVIAPTEIGRDSEHNSALFRIVTQPASLDQYACRAEIETAAGSTYRLVSNGEFSLTNDIAVRGLGRLQLVYSDGVDAMRKTSIAGFHVTRSINAVDESAPDFADGLAQLQSAAFARVDVTDVTLAFYNLAGQQVGVVTLPAGAGGGLDEAAANLLYLRRDGSVRMTGSIQFEGANRGVIFDVAGLAPAIYADATGLRLRRPLGDAEVTIEDSSGVATTRSPVMTEASGDARYDGRYLQPAAADSRYLQKAGDVMTGDLGLISSAGIDAVIGIVLGGRAARIYWDAALVLRRGTAGEPVVIENNNGSNRSEVITQLLGDARYLRPADADSTYLRRDGGQMAGPLITMPGSSSTDLGIAIGENSTGFWRSSSSFLLLVVGGAMKAQWSASEMMSAVRLNMANQQVTNLADPTTATGAANRRYVDDAIAAVTAPTALRTLVYMPNELTITATAIGFLDINFPMPPGGLRNILVTVDPIFASTDAQGTNWHVIYATNLIALESPVLAYKMAAEPTGMFRAPAKFTAAVDATAGSVRVIVYVRAISGAPTLVQVGVGGSIAPSMRSLVTVQDLGPV